MSIDIIRFNIPSCKIVLTSVMQSNFHYLFNHKLMRKVITECNYATKYLFKNELRLILLVEKTMYCRPVVRVYICSKAWSTTVYGTIIAEINVADICLSLLIVNWFFVMITLYYIWICCFPYKIHGAETAVDCSVSLFSNSSS